MAKTSLRILFKKYPKYRVNLFRKRQYYSITIYDLGKIQKKYIVK